MDSNKEYFLAVVEEMNISRAAKKLYMSQQSLSYHIKQLEKEYNTALFNRTPRLSLTLAGERMLRTLQQMKTLENNLSLDLRSQRFGRYNIRFMMPEARFGILAAPIIHRFHELHPNVYIELHGNPTSVSEKKLLNGECDLFLGLNPTEHKQFEIIPLFKERILIIGKQSIFKRTISRFDERGEELSTIGLDLREIEGSNIILPHISGIMGQQMNSFIDFQQLHFNVFLCSNNSELHFNLCKSEDTFSIFSEMHLCWLREQDLYSKDSIISFPIKNFPYVENVCLVRNKDTRHAGALNDLASIVKEVVSEVSSSINV